jgi:nucleotide-binding universal stress UspA family protein
MRILCATDLLSRNNAVSERAGYLAERLKADLTLLHVVPSILPERDLLQELQAASHEMKLRWQSSSWPNGSSPHVIVRAGEPTEAILDTAKEMNAGFVVLGARRRRSVGDAARGTLAEKILASRVTPTLIVRRRPRGPYRDVVLALDLTRSSASAVRSIERLRITVDAPRCTVLHVYEPPYEGMMHYAGVNASSIDGYIAGWRREYRGAIGDVLSAESRWPWRYDVTLAEGKAASVIPKHVERQDPDLLVMGTRAGGRLHRALLGSVAHEVLSRVRCDVLVVPQKMAATMTSRTSENDRQLPEGNPFGS